MHHTLFGKFAIIIIISEAVVFTLLLGYDIGKRYSSAHNVTLPLPTFSPLPEAHMYKCQKLLSTFLRGVDVTDYGDPPGLTASIRQEKTNNEATYIDIMDGKQMYITGDVVAGIEANPWRILKNTDSILIATQTYLDNRNISPANAFILDKTKGVAVYSNTYTYLFHSVGLVGSSIYMLCRANQQ